MNNTRSKRPNAWDLLSYAAIIFDLFLREAFFRVKRMREGLINTADSHLHVGIRTLACELVTFFSRIWTFFSRNEKPKSTFA